MGIFSLFSRRQADTNEPTPADVPAIPLAPASRLAPLRRDEVIDRQNRLYGYRFSLSEEGDETLLFAALAAERIEEFATRRMAVIPLGLDMTDSSLYQQFAAEHTVFVLDPRGLHGQDGIDRLQGLRHGGARSALRGMPSGADEEALLDACDILFLDLGALDLSHFHRVLEKLKLKHPKLKLAVEGVDSWAERRMCLEWGADYCLGSFLSQADVVEEEDGSLDQSRLTALKLLNLLRSDADMAQLAEVAKQDPAVTFQLLKWANAPIHGHASPITSLGQAILVLGRNVLYRWLVVAIFKLGRQRERDAALLEVALRRARFLELINPGLTSAECDELFLVGLFSLFDLLLGIPVSRLLTHMNLSQDTRDVLLRSEGKYGPYLRLALVAERGDSKLAAAMATVIGIDPAEIGPVQAAAFAWTQESLRQQAS